jgi:hypothetical protein
MQTHTSLQLEPTAPLIEDSADIRSSLVKALREQGVILTLYDVVVRQVAGACGDMMYLIVALGDSEDALGTILSSVTPRVANTAPGVWVLRHEEISQLMKNVG